MNLRRRLALYLSLLAATPIGGVASAQAASVARFERVDYEGEDGKPLPPGVYRNPVLAGFYPDPAVIRVDEDYYLVNSTFTWFPGLPIFHSRDLVNWRQIGNTIDRPGQFDFSGLEVSRGIFAPGLTYHAGRFYMVGTCVDCGGNFVMTASRPEGPWSDPVWLPTVEGIDPSLVFDDDGKAWLVNNRLPEGKPQYDGHRAIWIERFDPQQLKMLGNPKMIVNGGIDLARKPVWIEGPHIYKVDGHYYLSAAEGGTSVNHSQVILRADKIDGPYVPAPADVNPILTQRDLPEDRTDPITSAGHADLVETQDGRWWAVFLATRPYEGNLYNTGRETFLLPVSWESGWPVILEKGRPIPRIVSRPLPPDPAAPPQTGSFSWHDEFEGASLGQQWLTMRGASVTVGDGALLLDARRDGLSDLGKPAFAGRRQQHLQGSMSTTLSFSPAEGESAGLAAIQNDNHFLAIALTRRNGTLLVRVSRRAGEGDPREGRLVAERTTSVTGPMRLRIRFDKGRYGFDMDMGSGWMTVADGVDATNLSTEKAGGFVGTIIGPFAQGAC